MFPVDDLLVGINRLVREACTGSEPMPAGRLVIDFDPERPHVEVSWHARQESLQGD